MWEVIMIQHVNYMGVTFPVQIKIILDTCKEEQEEVDASQNVGDT